METDAEADGVRASRQPDGDPPRPEPVLLAPDQQPVAVLEELLIARGERLLRAAVMLAGSHADGEDLLQAALERVYRHWGHMDGDPEGYLRRTLYHLAADGWRRKGMLRARLRLLRQPVGAPVESVSVDQRDELVRLLRELPPRQRTAVILRYWEELSEAETARLMGCSVGNVKSSAARGLRRLRELSGEASGTSRATATGPTRLGTARVPADVTSARSTSTASGLPGHASHQGMPRAPISSRAAAGDTRRES